MKITDEIVEAAALVKLAYHNIPTDVQELIVHGDASRGIPPYALRSAIEAAIAAYVGENEPVAWVYTHPVGSVVRFERLAEGARPDLIETPLFTHPATDLVPALVAAEQALKPLSDAVFNDNGDMTISVPLVNAEQCTSAYFAVKALRAALSLSSGEGK